jgi:hypothetical protein
MQVPIVKANPTAKLMLDMEVTDLDPTMHES